ncbi:MAG: molybdenum cofactor guanylyltransferase [Candidatus Thorarchaeota archaeon]
MSKLRVKSKNLAVAILIGGKSTRFGSDKGLFPLFGKPLISHQIEILSQISSDIFLVAHSRQQVQNYINTINIADLIGFIIDDDQIRDKSKERTPIIGFYSAFYELNNLGYKKTFVLACDLPLIQKNVVNFLYSQCQNYDCCVPQWKNGFLEPLFAIYPTKKALISTKENIKKKNFKLINLIDEAWNTNLISIEKSIQPLDPNLLSFLNINSKKDLEKITKNL